MLETMPATVHDSNDNDGPDEVLINFKKKTGCEIRGSQQAGVPWGFSRYPSSPLMVNML